MKLLERMKQLMGGGDHIGFAMDEVMTGEHQFEPGYGPPDGPDHRFMEFRITWGPPSILHWLNPFGDDFLSQPLHGTITIAGLCQDAPCAGTLELRYFSERAIRYQIHFRAAGVRYRLVAEKIDIWPWNLHHSHTTCYGRLFEVDSGNLVSTSVTHFRLRTLPAFVRSLRLAWPIEE